MIFVRKEILLRFS